MSRRIDLLSVPSEWGALNGTSGGPDLLREPLHLALTSAGHRVVYEDISDQSGFPILKKPIRKSRGRVHHKREVAKVADIVAGRTRWSLENGGKPFVLGGEHSISMGSVRAALEFARAQKKKLGLIWFDAHDDAHTGETTHSGNANGMPFATLLGYGPRIFRPTGQAFSPAQVIHLGAGTKDVEPEEEELLDRLGVRRFSATELHRHIEPAWIASLALVDWADYIYVSLDLDVMDRSVAPAVHLQRDDGMSRKTALWLAEFTQVSHKLIGLDIMECKRANEEFDEEGRGKTATFAADFVLTLLGNKKS